MRFLRCGGTGVVEKQQAMVGTACGERRAGSPASTPTARPGTKEGGAAPQPPPGERAPKTKKVGAGVSGCVASTLRHGGCGRDEEPPRARAAAGALWSAVVRAASTP